MPTVYLTADTIKTWFVSRAKPLASQFAQWIDACWLKGQRIPAADIDGLSDYLGNVVPASTISFAGYGSFTIPAGYSIWKIYALNPLASTLKAGTAIDGDDLLLPVDLLANATAIINLDVAADAARTIFFYVDPMGGSSYCTLKIYLHRI